MMRASEKRPVRNGRKKQNKYVPHMQFVAFTDRGQFQSSAVLLYSGGYRLYYDIKRCRSPLVSCDFLPPKAATIVVDGIRGRIGVGDWQKA